MNVLSLFDGMSCGRIALERAGIKVDKYFASEIDKYAISVAKHNYPETVHLGNVQFITKEMFGNTKIDLIIGGSPCQGFSFAGKQLNFEDERSKLFFEFVRLLRDLKPKYFLLENVRMKKESQDVITDMLGVEPIVINSKLVSAQNRHRLYWTNIPGIEQPEDKGILLKDILEENCPPEMFLSEKAIGRIERHGNKITKKKENPDKSATIHAGYFKGGGRDQQYVIGEAQRGKCEPREFNPKSTCHHAADATDIKGNESIKRVYADTGKSPTITTMGGGHREPKVLINESETDDGKSYCVTARYSGAVAWNSCERKQRTMVPVEESNDQDPNVYNGLRYRKLTPVECERLQTVDDNYTALGTDASGKTVKVSNTQRYKMIGNGWTVDVITHMFKNIQE